MAAHNPNLTALQYTDHVRTEGDAQEQLDGLKLQDGYLGGRVMHSVKGREDREKPWLVQALFRDEPEYREGMLEGMRRVVVPENLRGRMGISNPQKWLRVNPAVSPEQYRLAQAVLSGTTKVKTMPVKVAREIVDRTPERLRSEYSKYNPSEEEEFGDLHWLPMSSQKAAEAAARLMETDGAEVWVGERRGKWGVWHKHASKHNPGDFLVTAFSPRDSKTGKLWPEGASSFSSRESAYKYFQQLERNGYPVVLSDGTHLLKMSGLTVEESLKYGVTGVRLARKSNPESEAKAMYESFHGAPSENVTEFDEEEHYHGDLAELGILLGLKVRTVTGYDITLQFEDAEWEDGEPKESNPLHDTWLARKLAEIVGRSTGRNWIPWKTLGKEADAYREEARLAGKGVSARVDRVGRFGKYTYEVLVDREQVRGMLHAQARNPRKGTGPNWMEGASAGAQYAKQMGHTELSDAELAKAADDEIRERKIKDKGYGIKPRIWPRYKLGFVAGYKIYRLWESARAENPKRGPFGEAYRTAKDVGGYLDKRLGKALGNPTSSSPTLLCSNETGNQLYFVGGNQYVDTGSLELKPHDSIVIGEAWDICYKTTKDFDDHQTIEYIHGFGDEEAHPKVRGDLWENAKPPEELFGTGDLPNLRYDCLNHKLYLDGGVYFIHKPNDGSTSPGIED